MKGQVDISMKPLILIFIIVLLVFLLMSIYTHRAKELEAQKSLDLTVAATNTLLLLANSDKCVTYKSPATQVAYGNILDVKKLDRFTANYNEIEPDCARSFEFGWRATVEEICEGGECISDVKILIISDTSGSMNDDIENIRNEIPRILENLRNDGINAEMTLILLGSGDYSCNDFEPIPYFSCIQFSDADQDRCNLFEERNEDWGNGLKCAIEDFEWGSSIRVAIPLSDELPGGSECTECGGDKGSCSLREIPLENGIVSANINEVVLFPMKGSTCPSDDPSRCNCDGLLTEYMTRAAQETGGQMFNLRRGSEAAESIEQIARLQRRQPWSFGAREFSQDKALNNKVEFWIPIAIRYTETSIKPGKMYLTLVDGELEKVAGFLDWSCQMGVLGKLTSSSTDVKINYPITYDSSQNYLCSEGKTQSCRKLMCELAGFDGLQSAGIYSISTTFQSPNRLLVRI